MSILKQKTTKTVGFSSILATFALLFIISLQSSCAKSNACDLKASYTNDANAAQNTAMVAFCTTNNITYSTHPSGILYQIITLGDTAKPNLCTPLSMTYTGKLMTGIQFDKGTITLPLKDLIVGWQIAVPMLGKGGKMKMVIPSSLAYGAQGNPPVIPSNAPIYFEMALD
jgi:FKBP-type peptidyl-prolyl cis-trans isomerase